MPKLIKEVCGAVISGALIVWVGAMLLTNEPCERLSRFDWLPTAAVHATLFLSEPFVSKGTAAGIGDSLNVVRTGLNGIFAKIVLRKSLEELGCSSKRVTPSGEIEEGSKPPRHSGAEHKISEIDEARELLRDLQKDIAKEAPPASN